MLPLVIQARTRDMSMISMLRLFLQILLKNRFLLIYQEELPAPTFYIHTFEDVPWVWSLSSFDENDNSLWLAAKDFDRQQATYELPTWKVVGQPSLGFVPETLGLDENWLDSNLSVPLLFDFTPIRTELAQNLLN